MKRRATQRGHATVTNALSTAGQHFDHGAIAERAAGSY
jgi:hypothetical protein